MSNSNSGKVSKGDIISFIALFLLGIIVFFGMNFIMLGNFVPSVIISVLLTVLMVVFVYLAAFAKAQNRDQDTWAVVKYSMIVLYVAALVPCYFGVAKFCDIQLSKGDQSEGLMADVKKDVDDINEIFQGFEKMCESRGSNLKTELDALITYREGREKIISSFNLDKKQNEITEADVDNIRDSFVKTIMKDFNSVKREKETLVQKCMSDLESWNILFLPETVSELSAAKSRYSEQIETIVSEIEKNPLEKEIPSFEIQDYDMETNVADKFKDWKIFSVLGLCITLFLGLLGLLKFFLGQKPTVVPLKRGEASVITEDGGFTF